MASNFLKKKYGPLPGWGWGVVLGGGLLLGLYLRKRFANAASSGSSGGGSVPSSVQPSAADMSGGTVGASAAPADSGLASDLENALLNSQNSLVNTVNTLGGVVTAQQQSFGDLTTQAFDFEKSITSDLTGLLQHLGTTAPGGTPSSQTTTAPGLPPTRTATSPAGSVTKTAALTATSLESKAAQNALKGPTVVSAKANKTGVSANKGQGVISIH